MPLTGSGQSSQHSQPDTRRRPRRSSFATYSSDLRDRLSLDQSGLEYLATAKDLGAYVGVLSGLFHDAYGPRRTVLFGATLHCVGYFGLYSLCGDSWPASSVPVWQPALLLGLAANGAGFIDMGCLMTMLHNAGAERALMAGVAKALLGLCGSVLTAVYIAFIKPDARDFLLLLAATPLLVGACDSRDKELIPRLRSRLTRQMPQPFLRPPSWSAFLARICTLRALIRPGRPPCGHWASGSALSASTSSSATRSCCHARTPGACGPASPWGCSSCSSRRHCCCSSPACR